MSMAHPSTQYAPAGAGRPAAPFRDGAELVAELERFEAERKDIVQLQMRRARMLFQIAAAAAIVTLASLYLIIGGFAWPAISHWLGVACLIAVGALLLVDALLPDHRPVYRAAFKQAFLPRLLHDYGAFELGKAEKSSTVPHLEKLGLLPARDLFGRIYDDRIEGVRDRRPVRIDDIGYVVDSVSYMQRWFRALVIEIEGFATDAGLVVISPKRFYVGYLRRPRANGRRLKRVRSDNAAFDNAFAVYAEDSNAARTMLTSDAMQRLLAFAKAGDIMNVGVLIDGAKRFIVIENGHNSFDLPSYDEANAEGQLGWLLRDLDLAFELTDFVAALPANTAAR